MALLTGQVVGNYEIFEEQQSGTIYSLYRARSLPAQEDVLFWALLPGVKVSDDFLNAFLERGKQLKAIRHPNLLAVLEWAEVEGQAYWVTPQIQGRLLAAEMEKGVPERQAAQICAQVAAALACLHENGLRAGLLAPDTVALTAGGEVLLAAYGAADLINDEIRRLVPVRSPGYGAGDPSFLAPEILSGYPPAPASDQYAMGALMFALLNGRPPFAPRLHAEPTIRPLFAPPDWPVNARRAFTAGAIRFVHRCMSREASGRFRSAEEARKVLERIAQGRRTRVALTREQRQGAPLGAPPLALAAAFLLALALLAAGGFAGWRAGLLGAQQPDGKPAAAAMAATPSAAPTSSPTPPAAISTPTPTPAEQAEPQATEPASTPAPEQPTPAPLEEQPVPALLRGDAPAASEAISLQNLAALREQVRLGTGRLNSVDYAKTGGNYAVASSAGVFIFHEATLIKFLDSGDVATSVKYSLDDSILAVGLKQGEIQLWDTATYQKIGALQGHSAAVSRILFSPNRQHLISASYDLSIKVWDINTQTLYRSLPAHPQPIQDLAISDDALLLASCSLDPVVKLWNLEDGTKKDEFLFKAKVLSVALSPDGAYLAAGSADGDLAQWKTIDGSPRTNPINIGRPIFTMQYAKGDSELILGVGGSQYFKIGATYRPDRFGNVGISRFSPMPENPINALGGDFEFSERMAIDPESDGRTFVRWDGSISNNPSSNWYFTGPAYDRFTYLRFSPDSKYLLIGGRLGTTYLWTTANDSLSSITARIPAGEPFDSTSQKVALITKKIVQAKTRYESERWADHLDLYQTPSLEVEDVLSEFIPGASTRFVMDNRLLIATTSTRSKFWDIDSKMETEFQGGNDHGCMVLRSANNGEVFAAYASLGIMTTWDDLTRSICGVHNNFDPNTALLTSDRGSIIYINRSGQLEKYSTAEHRYVWRVPIQTPILAWALSPDNALLAAGAADGSVIFWNLSDGTVAHSFRAHFGAVTSVAFSPDGQFLATGSEDGTVRIWAAGGPR